MSRNLLSKRLKKAAGLAVCMLLLSSCLMGQDLFTKITSGAPATEAYTSFGTAWIDYDNDHYLDIFVANFPIYGTWPELAANFLYHNNGDGTFTRITGDPITEDSGLTWCGTWGDYDNDGYADMYAVNGWMDNQLYHNNGDGSFTRITSGIIVNDGITANGGNWIDYDNDGLIDMFVANDGAGGTIYDRANSLYKNNGNGVFTLETAGDLATDLVTSHSAVWCDYDNDGDLDAFIANYNNADNQLLMNNGDGTFTDIDAGHMTNDGAFSTGASWGDYDNDGDFDLIVINFTGLENFFYENLGDGTFNRRTDLVVAENTGGALSSCFGDYDNDGDLDLLVTNGDFQTDTLDYNNLYENNGDGTFTKLSSGIIVTDPGKSCGGAWGDYDRDGDLDLYIARFYSYQPNGFYQNSGNDNNWINIKCIGFISNKSAIGTRVKIKATTNGTQAWQFRQVESQSGYSAQNLNIHFGLGDASIIDSLVFEWSSGIVQVMTDVTPNQHTVVEEPCCHIPEVAGDADFNNIVNLLDITYLISFLYKGGPAPVCLARANANGNDLINLLDITYLIAYLYKGGPAPVCPL